MTKHTRGPWIAVGAWVEHPNDEVADICSCDPAAMGQAHLKRSVAETYANARLIAAAPSLLKALQAIVDQEQHDGSPETHMHDMADIARAAIAGATWK